MTDRDGNLVQHYPDVSGFDNERYSEDNSAFSVSNRYTGQILDEDTGLYYYGARYYDPELGRFIQADPIVPGPDNSQAFNRYSYCLNNPLKFVDPTGHSSWWADLLNLIPEGSMYGAGSTWLNITGEGLPVNGVSIPASITVSPSFFGAGALSDAISGSALAGSSNYLVSSVDYSVQAAILKVVDRQYNDEMDFAREIDKMSEMRLKGDLANTFRLSIIERYALYYHWDSNYWCDATMRNSYFYIDGRKALGSEVNYYFISQLMAYRGLDIDIAWSITAIYKKLAPGDLNDNVKYFFHRGYTDAIIFGKKAEFIDSWQSLIPTTQIELLVPWQSLKRRETWDMLEELSKVKNWQK